MPEGELEVKEVDCIDRLELDAKDIEVVDNVGLDVFDSAPVVDPTGMIVRTSGTEEVLEACVAFEKCTTPALSCRQLVPRGIEWCSSLTLSAPLHCAEADQPH